MATAKVLSSITRVEPGSHAVKAAELPIARVADGDEPVKIVSTWLDSLQRILASGDFASLNKVFLPNSYWRDQLCLTWNFHTLNGPAAMADMLSNHPQGSRLKKLAIDDSSDQRKPCVTPIDFKGEVRGVSSFLTLENDIGTGRGIVRLCKDDTDGQWKAFTFFTAVHALKGHSESTDFNRPHGVLHGSQPNRLNWYDRRQIEVKYQDREPTVFILGGGQAGLTLAARLKTLGVDTLIVDRNKRIGDSWRNRYYSLVLHDPVWYDHLPYMPFPSFWPKFTPKNKLGDWFEQYANSLEMNYWTSTTVKSLKYSDSEGKWTVNLTRVLPDGTEESRELHPKFVVQATGHSGEKNFPSHIPGINEFKGDFLGHSSEFPGAKSSDAKKKAIVVGCCNSGHDIAQAYYENGFDVTMVQRTSTYVMSSEHGLDVLLGGLYEEGGPPTEDADLTFISIPNPLLKRLHVDATTEIARRDEKLLQGLRSAGFAADNGPDDAGFFMKYFQRGGGYYIDVGASQLIIDGKIKIKQGQDIERVLDRGLRFQDGTELEADEIVFATGYTNMRDTCRKIVGDETADRVESVWGLDEEGEIRTMWRRTGHPGFFYMGGNLGLCRYYSRMLALQIKALEEGIMKPDSI